MSLTIGRGPLGSHPAGRLNFEPPPRVVLAEPVGRRVRAVRGGETVVDTDDALLVHVSDDLPRYALPAKHVHVESAPHPDVDGHVTVEWDAVDAWFEEDERVLVHPRDPYHRIDTFSTSRRLEVAVNGAQMAESTRTLALHETGLPVRYYFPRADVRLDRLVPSDTTSECAYKGSARHWSARVDDGELIPDIAWSYDDEVRREGEAVRGRVAFYTERVDLTVDGVAADRPHTPWSR